MTHDPQHMRELLDKMQQLQDKQKAFGDEIDALKKQLNQLMMEQFDVVQTPERAPMATPTPTPKQTAPEQKASVPKKPSKTRSELEKFVGENLISKIGIGVTILGVGIGAKYAIDNELNPELSLENLSWCEWPVKMP